ncbi:MAG: diacylglycerol/lipid kinase family protein [Flammeovirgaceae bacterium]
MKREFLLVINPVAGKKDKDKLLAQTKHYLNQHSFAYQTFFTRRKGHAIEYLQKSLLDRYTDIIVIGGDGTVNEVLNGLKSKNHSIPISIIPTGTGNDYIKSLPFPKTLAEQLEVAAFGRCLAVDIGRCNGRYFLNTMGFGFDGKVVATMEERGKRFGGHLAYLYTVLHTVTRFSEPQVRFIIDGKERKERIFLMAINNGTTYGGGFKITPNAQVDDGFFNVCLIKKISVWRRFLNLPKLQKGTHTQIKEVEMLQCQSLLIDYAPHIQAHIDGEFIGSPPYEVQILPKAQLVRVK